jgi:DNA-binding NarL/FixJ family response regulator
MRINRQADMKVCGEAADVAEALSQIAKTNPDAAVVDISLKTGSGIDLIKRIKARNNGVRILVWSIFNENLYAERALRAGAMGFINKETATEQIINALRRVLDGKVYLSQPIADQLINRTVGRGLDAVGASPVDALSDRELQVLQLMGDGLETQQIAKNLHISPKTVETYRARIKEKLNLSSGTELMRLAVQWRLENV